MVCVIITYEYHTPFTMKTKSPEIREELIRIATDKFLALGYERTSMAQISAAFGGSKTTLYTHFPTKEEMFLAVIENLARGKVDSAFSALTLHGAIKETLINFGEKYLSITCSKEILKVFRMGISESENSRAGKLLYEFGPKLCRKKIADYFDKKKSEGVIKKCESHVAAIHYLRLIESDLSELFLLGMRKEPSKREIRKAVLDGVNVFLAAYLMDNYCSQQIKRAA